MFRPPADEPPAPESGAGKPSPTPGSGVDDAELSALFADIKTADAALASAVRRAGALAAAGVAERVEGGPLEWALTMACRMTGTDARHLVAAGEILRALPTVQQLFDDAALSWGQVRRMVDAARRLTVAQRGVLDARIAAAIAQYDGIDAFDPDHLCDSVDAAAEQLRDARSVQRAERAANQANFLAIQGRIDGGATGYFSGDAVGVAPILNALNAARPIPVSSDGKRHPDTPTRQGQQNFLAMRDICAEYLSGINSHLDPTFADHGRGNGGGGGGNGSATGGAGRDGAAAGGGGNRSGAGDGPSGGEDTDAGVGSATARAFDPAAVTAPVPGGRPHRRRRRRRSVPLFTVQLDLSQFRITPAGTIELNVPGALPRISAAVMEILASDAQFRAVLFDGRRPLAVSRKIHANDIPADTRVAVRARDGGDRFPGSQAPITWTEPHHIIWRRHGGTHDPDNLASFNRRWHTRVHNDGWTITLIPHTGEIRAKRRGRTWRSLPKTTGLPPPPHDQPHLTEQQPGDNPPGTLPF